MKEIKISFEALSVSFGNSTVIKDITLDVIDKRITCLIGPSGCGKTTLLKTVNRLNDLAPDVEYTGNVVIDGINILSPGTDITNLRRKAAIVFQRPAMFARSVFENVAFPLRIAGVKDRSIIEEKVIESLQTSVVWDEVKDRLDELAMKFSIGQQQRIAIARALIS